MGKWTHSDTSEATGSSQADAAKAGHQARDDAVAEGIMTRGGGAGNSEKFSNMSQFDSAKESSGGFFASIFGGGKK